MRTMLMLLRAIGILAVLTLLYAWVYPASISRWMGGDAPAIAAAPSAAPVSVATAPASAPAGKPAAPAPIAPTPLPASWQNTDAPPPAVKASAAQKAMAQWLGAKYRTAPSAIEVLIVEADRLSKTYQLSPNLLIAVMAIESNFHPYIQSEAGAQGLMQVMPAIHARRYEKYGGKSSFIDPVVSLKVGAEILRDCVKLKGSETEALRFYFGGGPASDGYIDKVRVEQSRLNRVAGGRLVAVEEKP